MMETLILPFPGDFALGGLFDSATAAEGRLAWFETLARKTLARGEHAVLVVAIVKDRPAAALPLVRTPDGLRALTAPYTTRYAPPLPRPEIARELGKRAAEYVPGVLRLDALDAEDAGTAALLDGLERSALASARYRGFANWFEPVGDFDAWWSARPSRLKATVKRKLAAAQRQSAAFEVLREGFDGALTAYEEIYASSWKNAEPHPEFMRAMVESLGREGLVRMGILTLAGRAVAAQIWLVCNGRATIFKLAHRQDAAALSPGTLLTHHMVRRLISEDGLAEIDYGRGDDAYKRDWLSRRRSRTGVIAADWRKAAGMAAVAKEVLPTRLGSWLQAFGRQSKDNRHGSVAELPPMKLSVTPLGSKTGVVGSMRGTDAPR